MHPSSGTECGGYDGLEFNGNLIVMSAKHSVTPDAEDCQTTNDTQPILRSSTSSESEVYKISKFFRLINPTSKFEAEEEDEPLNLSVENVNKNILKRDDDVMKRESRHYATGYAAIKHPR